MEYLAKIGRGKIAHVPALVLTLSYTGRRTCKVACNELKLRIMSAIGGHGRAGVRKTSGKMLGLYQDLKRGML